MVVKKIFNSSFSHPHTNTNNFPSDHKFITCTLIFKYSDPSKNKRIRTPVRGIPAWSSKKFFNGSLQTLTSPLTTFLQTTNSQQHPWFFSGNTPDFFPDFFWFFSFEDRQHPNTILWFLINRIDKTHHVLSMFAVIFPHFISAQNMLNSDGYNDYDRQKTIEYRVPENYEVTLKML